MDQTTISPATRRRHRSGPVALALALVAVALAIVGSLLARKLPGPGCHESEHVGVGTTLMYVAFFVLCPASVILGIVASVVGPSSNRVLAVVAGVISIGLMLILWRQFYDWTYWCGN